MKHRSLLLLAAALLCGTVAVYLVPILAPAGPLHDLARARPERVFAPRLSIATEYRPCEALATRDGGTVPREQCGESGVPAGLDSLAAAGESADPDSLQASALLGLMREDTTGASLGEAITRLARALHLPSRRVPLLVDLSAAHLERAQRTQNPRDLVEALSFAREALSLEPGNLPALFNAALALDALVIDGEAARTWDAYLAIDSTSRWAAEARSRRAAAARRRTALRTPGPGAPVAEVEAFASRHPQETRELGWEHVLGEWGRAVERGDRARAGSLLGFAARLGDALERRPGDAGLADAVRAIRAQASNDGATRRLARAHREYADGRARLSVLDHAGARQAFERVLNAPPPVSPVLLQWVRVSQGGALVYDEEYARAGALFAALALQMDSARHPAFAARVRLMWGTTLIREQEYAEAREQYEAAARLFERSGETEFGGSALAWSAEATFALGDTLAAYQSMHRALLTLREHPGSLWRHGLLMKLSEFAVDDGLPWAAVAIQDDDVATAMQSTMEMSPAEAHLVRARVWWSLGQTGRALGDLDRAAPLAGRISAPGPRGYIENSLRFSRALFQPGTPHSVAVLDSALNQFSKNKVWWLQTLFRRADARLAGGDVAGAIADLDSATARIRSLSRREVDGTLRTGMMEQARGHLDRLVMLHLHAGRVEEALRALERGRISLSPSRATNAQQERGRLRAPHGQVVVEYALAGDTLLTWTLRDSSLHVYKKTVNRAEFLLTVDRARQALASHESLTRIRPHLARLYDWLVRPVRDSLGRRDTSLVIVADGEIEGVPFAALWDGQRQRYLVEDRSVRSVASLEDALRPPLPGEPVRSALLVADPWFDEREYPSLYRLEGALAEVDSLRRLYPEHVFLAERGATPDSLKVYAPRASVIHYAGHAVFDDAWPVRSFLVLAGAGKTGRFTAESVGGLELRGVRLVVLSACRTLPSRQGRSGGFAGFSGALMAAGAEGVVGSLWEVDDQHTRRLMLEFHRVYSRRPDDPAQALRQAQLRLLRSGKPELSSPSAWAGFRYAGR